MSDKYIELTQAEKDDITVEDDGDNVITKSKVRDRAGNNNKNKTKEDKYENLPVKEMSKLIHSFEPIEIKDWPKRPYKTIALVFLLLFSGILFIYMSIHKYLTDHTWDVYVPYGALGILISIPGFYYTFILINVWLDREGYDYSDIPDMNDT